MCIFILSSSINVYVCFDFQIGVKKYSRKACKSVRNGSKHTCVCILWDNGDISRSLSGHLSPPWFYQRVAFIIDNILCSFAAKWLISKQRLLKSTLSIQTTYFCLFCFVILRFNSVRGSNRTLILNTRHFPNSSYKPHWHILASFCTDPVYTE